MAKLYFRYGAMGSSKSANILMVRYNYEERGQYAVLLKPRTDNRDGEHEIKSRIGLEAPAEYVDEFLKEISETWSADSGEYRYHGKKVDAVLIDEAQFLSPEEVDTLSDIVDFYGIPVLCYGLRADFQTHLFPGSRRLMEIADIIEEVPTVCWCGRRAQCNTISIYAGLAMFLESYMLWAGNNSPNNIGLTIVGYLYKRGIEKNDMGYACAVGVVLLVIALAINIVQLIANGTFKNEEK